MACSGSPREFPEICESPIGLRPAEGVYQVGHVCIFTKFHVPKGLYICGYIILHKIWSPTTKRLQSYWEEKKHKCEKCARPSFPLKAEAESLKQGKAAGGWWPRLWRTHPIPIDELSLATGKTEAHSYFICSINFYWASTRDWKYKRWKCFWSSPKPNLTLHKSENQFGFY